MKEIPKNFVLCEFTLNQLKMVANATERENKPAKPLKPVTLKDHVLRRWNG